MQHAVMPETVLLTPPERRIVAACIAAQMAAAPDQEARELARLWTLVHPEGAV